jgi:hypothetical protein
MEITIPMRTSPVKTAAITPETIPMETPLMSPTSVERRITRRAHCVGRVSTAMARITTAWLCAPLLPPTEATTGM